MMLKVHNPVVVAENDDVRFVWLGLDESEAEKGILANQYLLVADGEALLVDPGGYYVFERVYKNVVRYVDPEKVVGVFYSHQDPDVTGSLNIIEDFFPNAKIYVSAIWTRFLPHLGAVAGIKMVELPDTGATIRLGKRSLEAIPAHFLHSPGHFNLYVPDLKLLFTGDIGAAVFPEGEWYLYVENFDEHAKHMEWFHKRFMACRKALDKWLARVEKLDLEVIAPQHGAIFTGENTRRFIEWLRSLGPVGADILG